MTGEHQQIAVIGAGLMGHGIALTMARAGHKVAVHDPDTEALATLEERLTASLADLGTEKTEVEAILTRINGADKLADAVSKADVVFEAAPERLALKQEIFSEIEMHAREDAVLASNTSVIQITKIMQGLSDPSRALGSHWWNPAHMIPLVEIIKTEWTAPEIASALFSLLENAGKTPVMVEKDVPGFIGNRLQHALWREAVSLVEKGICDSEAIDTVVKSSFGRRLAALGPLENADLIGTDLTLDIHENVLFDLENSPTPSPYLRRLVDDGNLGMKSGKGFRVWSEEESKAVRHRVARHLSRMEQILVE